MKKYLKFIKKKRGKKQMRFDIKKIIKLTDVRDLVVSKKDDCIILAQQIATMEGQKVFMKNSIILTKDNLIQLKELLEELKGEI